VLNGLGGNLQKVIITKVESSTYYAEMIVRRNGEVFSLDARPSDSIAVALRTEARIFAQDDLLEEATIEIAEEESGSFEAKGRGLPPRGFEHPEAQPRGLRALHPLATRRSLKNGMGAGGREEY
jgi:bifunctional DNase/RNase